MILLNSSTIWSNDYSPWHRRWLPIICLSTNSLFLVVVLPREEQTAPFCHLLHHTALHRTAPRCAAVCGILTFIACTTASGFWPTGTYPAAGEDARSDVMRAGPCWNKRRYALIPFGRFKEGGKKYPENLSTSFSQIQSPWATCEDKRRHYPFLTSHLI